MLSSSTISKILYQEGIHKKETIIPLGLDSNLFKSVDKDKAKEKPNLKGKFGLNYYIPLICHNSLVPQKTETLRKRFYCLVPGGFY
jgi:hypothetical protein